MRLGGCWLLLITLFVTMPAEDGAPPPLAPTVAGLVAAQAQLQGTCNAANLPVSSGFTDALVVRRTIAADWQRRLDAGMVRADDPALGRFTTELKALTGLLDELEMIAREARDAGQRYPHCLMEPAFVRFRSLVGDTLAKRMQEVVAGRTGDSEAKTAWWRLSMSYRALLEVIEALPKADEDYVLLPRDDRWLLEYREYLLLARATLERAITTPDEHRGGGEQQVLSAYTHLLGRRVSLLERAQRCGLPAEHPALVGFRRAGEVEVAVLGRLVEVARQGGHDDEVHFQREERLHRELASAQRFSGLAYEWLDLEESWHEVTSGVEEQVMDAPVELTKEVRATVSSTTARIRDAHATFATAVETKDLLAAITAKHAGERVRQQADHRLGTLDEDIAIATREQQWRVHAKDPAVAEKLREWDQRRAVVLAARRLAEHADEAALAAAQDVERAELVRDQTEDKAIDLREAAERDDLWELINTLDEMAELRAGVQQ